MLGTGCEVKNKPIHNKLNHTKLSTDVSIEQIRWIDENGGLINAKYPFSLDGFIAPRLKKPGTINGASCTKENDKARTLIALFDAMNPEDLKIYKVSGYDDYGRAKIYLRNKDVDVGVTGMRKNLLNEWPKRIQDDSLIQKKYDFCGSDDFVKNKNPNDQWYCFFNLTNAHKYKKRHGYFKIDDNYCLAYEGLYQEICTPKEKLQGKEFIECGYWFDPHNLLHLKIRKERYIKSDEILHEPTKVKAINSGLSANIKITNIEWYDGDSGLINGKYPFMLEGLIAPKIGDVGSANGPVCGKERQKGIDLRHSFEKMEPKHLKIHKLIGYDKRGRARLFLRYKGTDVGLIGLRSNSLAEWPQYDQNNTRSFARPNWCDADEIVDGRNPVYQQYCYFRLSGAYRTQRKKGNFIIQDKHCLAYIPIYDERCQPYDKLTLEEKYTCVIRFRPHGPNIMSLITPRVEDNGNKEAEFEDTETTKVDTAVKSKLSTKIKITNIKWNDGDSGIINGRHSFILAKLVAPKIGRVDSVGGPKCVKENKKGLGLKKSFEKMEPEHLKIHKVTGYDDMGRAMVYLRYKGTDVGLIGLRANLLAEWPRRGQENDVQSDKPDWCGSDGVILDRNPDYQWYCFSRLDRAYSVEQKTGIFQISDKHCLSYKTIHKDMCSPKVDLSFDEKLACGLRSPSHNFNQLIDITTRLNPQQ